MSSGKYMRLQCLALGIMLSLSTVIQADATLKESSSDLISILQQSKSWELIYPNNLCVEKYQFLSSGKVIIDSDQEHVTGRYQYSNIHQSTTLPALVVSFETDNLGTDCLGNTVDQAGTSTIFFLKKEADQKFYFCNDDLGKNCPVYLRPQL